MPKELTNVTTNNKPAVKKTLSILTQNPKSDNDVRSSKNVPDIKAHIRDANIKLTNNGKDAANDKSKSSTARAKTKKLTSDLYPTNHLLVLSPSNGFRRMCVAISTSRPFEAFILLAIAFNCVQMALNEQLPNKDKRELNKILDSMDVYLLGIFCVEAALKIVSQGLILHPYSYLRSGWNLLDTVVIVTGILPLVLGDGQAEGAEMMKVIKAARVLRPLKFVSGVPSLQVVMSAILKSMASLLQICLLICFVIMMYGIIGLTIFKGKFHMTCYWDDSLQPGKTPIVYETGYLCSYRNKSGRHCPKGTSCQAGYQGPNYGITSFDNILLSCLTVFVCITCEGWVDTMYWTFETKDYNARYMWVYYYTLNIIGSQFMLNLVCGVLSGEFSKEKDRVENRAKFLAQREQRKLERVGDKYTGWVEDREEEKQRLRALSEEDAGEGFDPPDTSFKARFLKRNATVRCKLKRFMLSSFMYWLVILLVFLNSVSSGIQYYRQPQWITDMIKFSDIFFLAFFFLEMCLKMYSMGPKLYFKPKFNKFDFTVVTLGIINLLMTKYANINLGIPVLRQLRLVRLFKFTKFWDSMKVLMTSILSSMSAILSLLLLLFLFLMIAALLGMNLFGGVLQRNNSVPRTNFDGFFNAMLAVFQVITGEDWNRVMYESAHAMGYPTNSFALLTSLYFVGVTVLGNYVLLNVFLAIAVDNVSLEADESEEIDRELMESKKHMEEIRKKYSPQTAKKYNNNQKGEAVKNGNTKTKERDKDVADGVVIDEFCQNIEGGFAKPGDDFLANLKQPGRMTGSIRVSTNSPIMQVNTLFVLTPKNPIRILVHRVVSSPYFDNIILVLILISSMLLAFEDATNPKAQINKVLMYLDYGFTSIFAIEVFLKKFDLATIPDIDFVSGKIIHYGFIMHANSYCRDGWNVIDMVVVLCSIVSLVLSQDSEANPTVKSIVKILRLLRVMRPLKSINKLPKLKAVFQCMTYSLKNVVNVLMIAFHIYLIFSIIGVQLFMGKFFYCTDPSKYTELDCRGNFITFEDASYSKPTENRREWKLISFNFNHVGNALITLFAASTGEGWPDTMYAGIDSQDYDQGPIYQRFRVWVALYFIMFVIVISFFFINVFVGMIILTFQGQAESEAAGELDRNQKNSLIFAMTSKPIRRFMPEDVKSLQYKAWSLIESNAWELSIMFIIGLNTMVMLLEYHGQPDNYAQILNKINIGFLFVFCAEFLVKIFALGMNYFKDFWNIFDLAIVFVGLLDYLLNTFLPDDQEMPIDTSFFRLGRALRLVKLLRRNRSLRILLWTFVKSFKALPYVGMLMFLLFFIYAIIGMQLFALIDTKTCEDGPPCIINEHNHFKNYFSSTQVLFRIATGESWPNIMLACTKGARCDHSLPAVNKGQENCGNDLAYLYFVSFIFFCSFLLLNLFIAVIMDNFAFLTEDSSILGPHHLDEVVTVWSEFDPRASGRIKHTEICELLRNMLPPVGLGKNCPRILAYKRLVRMNMTMYRDQTVDYTGFFFALVRTGLDIYTDDANLRVNDQNLRKMLKRAFPNISKRTLDLVIPRTPKNPKHMTIGKIYAGKLILETYRFKMREAKKKNRVVFKDQEEERL